jgi:hypothetical protein
MDVSAQSYSGDIDVHMWRGANDEDCVRITANVHGRHSGTPVLYLYEGPMQELLNMAQRKAQLMALGLNEFLKEFDNRSVEK